MTESLGRKRWAVFISGRGSNLAALLDLRDQIDLVLVVSSSDQAHGLLRAGRAGVATELAPVNVTKSGSTKIDWIALDRLLSDRRITHVALAGFMKIIPATFLAKWAGRILNLHPSLLPAYPGLESISRAHADRSALGLTVHEVTPEVDAGRVISQRTCLSATEMRSATLARAEFLLHVAEQRVYREAVLKFRSMDSRVGGVAS